MTAFSWRQNEKCESEDAPREAEDMTEHPPSGEVKKTPLVAAARVR
jgi:hypothetical protein